jgi:lysophospholipase L1-like esterase
MNRAALVLALMLAIITSACGGAAQSSAPGATTSPGDEQHEVATADAMSPVARDTYLTLGDSVAAGIGASAPGEMYAAELFRVLRAADPTLSRHVNLAIPGETSASLLGRQMEAALAELASGRVRLVTLSIGANDLLGLLSTCQEELLSETCVDNAARQVDIVEENLEEAVELMREADPEVEVVLLDYYNPLAPVFPDTARYVADLNGVLHERATEDGLPLVVVFPSFDGHELELTHIEARDVHPNDDGHQLIADLAAAVILDAP